MSQLGKYQLVAEIARGGMGIVYLAIARGPARFSKLLVVKQLKPELVEDPSFLEMFLEEARLAARLNHPNIVQTYEVGSDGDAHYMVMDYLEGVTLARVLRRKNPRFTLAMHLRVICEALQGLEYAHTLTDFDGTLLGVIHRDATPQNVFVTYDGQVKLVDFGIAKALDSTLETSTGVLKGKPSYMAPEQIAGDVDPRADVFTVGVMLWEAVAGRRMWAKKNDVEILTNIIKGQVPMLADAAPNTPPELLAIIDRALAKSRDDRYPSASALHADLEAYLVSTGDNPNLREVGKIISEMFSAERTATRVTIDAHIAGIKAGKELTRLPSLRPPSPEITPDGTPVNERSRPSFASGSSLTPGLGRTPPGTEMLSSPTSAAAPAAQRNLLLAGGLGGAVIVAILAVALVATKKSPTAAKSAEPPPPAVPAPPTAAVDPRPAAPTGPATHEVTLKAFPKGSVLTIDGAEVGNPVKKTCTHGRSFAVHASSAGLVSVDRTISCEQDESIEIALTAQPVAPTPAPPPYRPPPPRAAPASAAPHPDPPPAPAPTPRPTTPHANPNEVNPGGGTKPNRPIDTSSPYNQ